MKKSEIYQLAMEAMLDTDCRNDIKIEILEVLMKDKEMALWSEKNEETDRDENI